MGVSSWVKDGAGGNCYRYNGKELSEELGLYAYGYRYYDPAIGRFTGVDPIADKFAHLSTYNYASNDPISNIDLHGLQGVNFGYAMMIASKPKAEQEQALREIIETNNSVGKTVGRAIVDETPGVGEMVSISEGDYSGALIGIIPFGKFFRRIFRKITGKGKKVSVVVDSDKYPDSAQHIDDALDSGVSMDGVVDRSGSSSRRRKNTKKLDTKPGMDRDEAPPAVIDTGQDASVRHVPSSDNRGAGSSIGHQLRNVPDGTPVTVTTSNRAKKKSWWQFWK